MLIWFNAGTRLLLNAPGGLILWSDSLLDFDAKIWLLLAIFLNIYRLAETLNNVACHLLKWLLPRK